MKNMIDVQRYLDSFSRPAGYNQYAWDVTKRIAREVWKSYFDQTRFQRPVNYLCKEFYQMIQRPEDGEYILPKGTFKMPS
jgi:hypothetical protein